MKLLRKSLSPKPKVTIATIAKHIRLVNGLKDRGVLKTTGNGVFYTYPEILSIGLSPDSIAKNLFLYARECNLVKKDQTLYFREMDEDYVIGQYDVKNGYVKV